MERKTEAQGWLNSFSMRLEKGQELESLGRPSLGLAIRWALAAFPAWPRSVINGQNEELTVPCVGKESFLEQWASDVSVAPEANANEAKRVESQRMVAWRAATWLAAETGEIWKHLLEEVVGFKFRPPPPNPPPLTLKVAPHGADHLVALVGAKSAGKTRFLWTLEQDRKDFNIERVNDHKTDWTQAKVRWPLLERDDLLSPASGSLMDRMRRREPSDTVSGFLLERLPPSTRQALTAEVPNQNEDTKNKLVTSLNEIIQGPSIWDMNRFIGVETRLDTQQLLNRSPEGAQLACLNRLLLEDAYPDEIHGTAHGTGPDENFTYRGVTSVTGGVRLIIHDVAGEELQGAAPGAAAQFQGFAVRFHPSAVVVIAGKSDTEIALPTTQRVCQNLVDIFTTAGLKLNELPVYFLFNFSDSKFGKDHRCRGTLLGPDPKSLVVNSLLADIGSRDTNALLEAIGDSEEWAKLPIEALAFQRAIKDFVASLNCLLPQSMNIALGFSCCAVHEDQALRQSVGSFWDGLHKKIGETAREATRTTIKKKFHDRTEDVFNELKKLRIMGARLAALSPPDIAIAPYAIDQMRSDWPEDNAGSTFDSMDDEMDALLKHFVTNLLSPSWQGWDLKEREFLPFSHDRLFEWLLTSLGIPLRMPLSESSASSATAPGQWGPDGWSGLIQFSCRWDEGATTIPSEWENGAGKSAVNKVRKVKGGPGSVGELIVKCLQEETNVKTIVCALTHAAEQRRPFPEQSLEPRSPDVYAYAAVSTPHRYFGKLRSIARCQELVVAILSKAATIRAGQFGDSSKLLPLLRNAWRLRLLHREINAPLTRQKLRRSLGAWASPTTRADQLRNGVHKFRLRLMPEVEAVINTNHPQSDNIRPVLIEIAALGELLYRLAGQRLAGFLHARLTYARKTDWFGDKPAFDPLKNMLESVMQHDMVELHELPWKIYEGEPIELVELSNTKWHIPAPGRDVKNFKSLDWLV